MKDAVMDSWFFDEPSDRSTFGRLQGKKVDDMVNTNFSIIEQKESIIEKYITKVDI